jgi:hypothetical protein
LAPRHARRFVFVLPAIAIAIAQPARAQTTASSPPSAAPAAGPQDSSATPAPPANIQSPGSTSRPNDDDAPDDKRAVAQMLFYTARGLMEDNKISKACKKFAESYRLDPAAGTLLNLAVCHEKEGKLASAWGEFHQAEAEARRSNRPDREQLAKDSIARIEPDLPYLTITVPKAVRVRGLSLQRNGVPLEEGAWETELPIDPGTNEITATAPQYQPEKKLVTVEKRQHLTVTLDPLVLAPIVRPPPPYWTSSRVIGLTAIAGGVVAAGVGSVFGVLALNSKSKSDAACPTLDNQLRCTGTGSSEMSNAQTQAWVADIGIGVGAAAFVTGVVLMLTGGAHEEGPPAQVGTPPGDHARPQAAWGLGFTGGAHGGQGFLTRSF